MNGARTAAEDAGRPRLILAPLRGVTVRCFRETFSGELAEAGFSEAVTPFIAASTGYDPLRDRELAGQDPRHDGCGGLSVTPQFIGKDPAALRSALERIKAAGWDTADLNAGCPFPMVRNKGRGSGLLRDPDLLCRMLEAGCETMGEGRFSLKARLGVDRPDELFALVPRINTFPLRFLTVHARTARQMYEGQCDAGAFEAVRAAARVPVVYNGDAGVVRGAWCGVRGAECVVHGVWGVMVGRSFVRSLGERGDAGALLRRYAEASRRELGCDHSVLGRLKELLSYWRDIPAWRRRWQVAKLARTVEELMMAVPRD